MAKITNLMHILSRHHKACLIAGYLGTGAWFTTTAVSAFCSFTAPVPQPQIIVSPQPEPAAVSNLPLISSAVIQDTVALRDPFVQEAPKVPAIAHQTDALDPSGIRVKAVILSLKSGVVLEDARSGAVYFLSEGEETNGILVKSISKTGVSVEIEGKQIDLKLGGNQR